MRRNVDAPALEPGPRNDPRRSTFENPWLAGFLREAATVGPYDWDQAWRAASAEIPRARRATDLPTSHVSHFAPLVRTVHRARGRDRLVRSPKRGRTRRRHHGVVVTRYQFRLEKLSLRDSLQRDACIQP